MGFHIGFQNAPFRSAAGNATQVNAQLARESTDAGPACGSEAPDEGGGGEGGEGGVGGVGLDSVSGFAGSGWDSGWAGLVSALAGSDSGLVSDSDLDSESDSESVSVSKSATWSPWLTLSPALM